MTKTKLFSSQVFIFLWLTLIMLLFASLVSCEKGIKLNINGEVVELKKFEALNGKHCESTAIMNALNYQEFPLTEAMINGLGSSMSAGFEKEGGFPFLGGRIGDFKENFSKNSGIKIIDYNPSNSQDAYDWTKSVLKKNIPVILRVDMRYLPYLHGGKYGSKYTSFGWHFITLIKIDEAEGYGYVVETYEEGLSPLKKIKLSDLAKARNASEGFLKADNYCYYLEIPVGLTIDYKQSLKNSLKIVIDNMNSSGLKALKNLPTDIINIEAYATSKYMLKPMFYTFYGYIEIFGTGGSAFRNFYRDYLIETGKKLGNKDIPAYYQYIDLSAKKWTELAEEFKIISDTIEKYYNSKDKRTELYTKASKLAQELYILEAEMISKFTELYNKL